MGPYDQVLIWDAPNDDAVTQALFTLGSHGNLRTMSMKALTGKEARQIIEGMPPA